MPPFTRPLLLLTLALAAAGCVSRSAYLEKTGEATSLAESVRDLRSRNDDLLRRTEELALRSGTLEDELAEARARISALQEDLIRSRADADRLEKILSARSAESGAAIAELRRTVERLREENRALALELERGRPGEGEAP